MLVDKRKTKIRKKMILKDKNPSEDTVQSFRTWVRKLEQTINSLSSRLSAVEKRLSRRKFDISNSLTSDGLVEEPIDNVFEIASEDNEEKNFGRITRILESEIINIQEELTSQQIRIGSINKKIDEFDSSLGALTRTIKEGNVYTSDFLEDVELRFKKIERREPPMMKVGKMEIPIEITGIIGGILAFITALIVSTNHKGIIVSPLFLSLVGFILIGSALFKAFNIRSMMVKSFKKTSGVTSKMEDGSLDG